VQLEGNERADALAELGRKSSPLNARAGRQPQSLLTPVAASPQGGARGPPSVDSGSALKFSVEMTPLAQGGKDRASLSQHTEGRDLRFGQLGASIVQDRKKCPGAPPQYVHARPRADNITKGATQQSSREGGVND